MTSVGPPPTEPPPVKPLEEPPAPLPADVCPTCGAGHEPRQEYCLEGGNRPPRTTAIIPTLPTTINTPTTTTAPTTTSQTPAGLIRWPDHNGWTIVLQSDPKNQGRTKPNSAAQRALDAGLQQVGILDSTNYSSLNPGYYVVFTGVYGSQSEASSQLNKARSAGFPLAYTRYVAR